MAPRHGAASRVARSTEESEMPPSSGCNNIRRYRCRTASGLPRFPHARRERRHEARLSSIENAARCVVGGRVEMLYMVLLGFDKALHRQYRAVSGFTPIPRLIVKQRRWRRVIVWRRVTPRGDLSYLQWRIAEMAFVVTLIANFRNVTTLPRFDSISFCIQFARRQMMRGEVRICRFQPKIEVVSLVVALACVRCYSNSRHVGRGRLPQQV